MVRAITIGDANAYALQAMMCSRAYAGDTNRALFPVEELGWDKVGFPGYPSPSIHENSYFPKSILGKIFSNLQFDIWEKQNSKETIVAFRGTDEKIDWIAGNFALGISVPYKSAKKKVKEYCDLNPDRQVSLTGHSLGGGIALSVSVWLALPAVVFNTSPRIFDGMRNKKSTAARVAIFQHGDILQWVRTRWLKSIEDTTAGNIIETHFRYPKGESNHRMNLLAEGILRAAHLQAYADIAKNIPVKFQVPPM